MKIIVFLLLLFSATFAYPQQNNLSTVSKNTDFDYMLETDNSNPLNDQLNQSHLAELINVADKKPQQHKILLSAEEQAFLKAHPVIRASNEMDWPPFDFVRNGQPAGYSIDLMNLIAERLGIAFEYVNGMTWTELLEAFQAKEIDVMSAIHYAESRTHYAEFTRPYFDNVIGVFGQNNIQSIADLNGKTIALPKDYALLEILQQELERFRHLETRDMIAAIKMVAVGDADFTIENAAMLQYLIRENAIPNVRLVFFPQFTGRNQTEIGLRAATHVDNPILGSLIAKALDTITVAETEKLKRKWLGSTELPLLAKPVRIPLTPSEQRYLAQHPIIKVSNEMDYPPYDFAVGGEPQGYSIDLLNLLAQKIGIQLEYVNGYTWAELVEMFKQGELALLHSLDKTAKRSQFGLFSEPYSRSRTHFVVRKASPDIVDIKQLYGKTVSVGKGWNIEEYLKLNHPQIRLLTVNSLEAMLEAVAQKKADATLENYRTIQYTMKKQGYYDLKLSTWFAEFDAEKNSKLYFMGQKNAPELIAMLNKALSLVTVDELDALEQKWFVRDSSATKPQIVLSSLQRGYLEQQTEITLCVDPNQMPFEGINQQGEHEGMAAEFMQLLSTRIGKPFRLRPTESWAETLALAQQRQCDVLPLAQATRERMAYLRFTEPYLQRPIVIATQANELFIDDIDYILDNHKKLAVVQGYAGFEMLKNHYPTIQLVAVDNVLQGIEKIRTGKVFGYVGNSAVISYQIQQHNLFDIKVNGKLDLNLELSVAVRDNNPLLFSIMQQAVASVSDAERQRIYSRWVAFRPQLPFDYLFWGQILFVLIVVMVAILVWMSRLMLMNRKIRQANQQIELAKQVAEKTSQTKSEFLANMSHEIRTPMNAIIGLSDLALHQDISPKLRDYLKKIHLSAHSLLGIINDILDFSKIEAGKLHIEAIKFDLDDIIHNLTTVLAIKTDEKGLELLFDVKPDVPRMLVGDPLRLGQILLNFANNAVKFTEQGHVIIQIECVAPPENVSNYNVTLCFKVIDTGIGMTEAQLNGLFQAFSQADTSITRKYGGTGLGLTISKNLAQMMEGDVTVHSEQGKGSIFTLTIPFRLAATRKQKYYAEHDDLKAMQVLVVDDNAAARQILSDMLAGFDFAVTTAASGHAAIAAIEQTAATQPFELVIMDCKMPGINGLETAKHIKYNLKLNKTPKILLMVAYGVDKYRYQAEAMHLTGLLDKPVSPSQLFNMILSIFGKTVAIDYLHEQSDMQPIAGLADIRGAHILLVEDNEINQQIATELLSGEQMRVDIAHNGQEALNILQQTSLTTAYDLILMDIQMPVMDGHTATQAIRDWEVTTQRQALPIIAMTAHAMAGEREKCIASGMNDYESKPINPQSLFATLVRWIKPGVRVLPTVDLQPPTAALADLPNSLDGIDIQSALARMGGNRAVYRKILLKFYRENTNALKELTSLVKHHDLETAMRLAHSIKGMAGNIGADSLYQATAELEAALRQDNLEQAQLLFTPTAQALDHVLAAIQPLAEHDAQLKREVTVSEADEIPNEEIDYSAVIACLEVLPELVETDLGEAREKLDELATLLGDKPEIKLIVEALDDYDTDAALEHIQQLAKQYATHM